MTTLRTLVLATSLTTLLGSIAVAAPIKLTFEGIANFAAPGDFYDGGAGGNLGVTFSDGSLVLTDVDAGGLGNFGGEPSPDNALFFDTLSGFIDVASGFSGQISLYYSAPFATVDVTLWDGLGGTGDPLSTFLLAKTPFRGAPDPTGDFSPFIFASATFAGTALSVSFTSGDGFLLDDIVLGGNRPTGVPDTAPTALLLVGAAGLAASLRRRLTA